MRYQHLDRQIGAFSRELAALVGLQVSETGTVATSIAAETRFFGPAARAAIVAASPVPLRDRITELTAFQAFMDYVPRASTNPALTRAQVITQNYVCFVYLSEACFRALLKESKSGSVTRQCCKFLTNNPVRAFRNAIAHSNWTYAANFDGLIFRARKGSDQNEPLTRFELSQSELDFWQTLSRGVAYAAYTSLDSFNTN